MPSLISFIVLYHLGSNYITESSKTLHYMLLLKPSLISGIGLCWIMEVYVVMKTPASADSSLIGR